MFRRLSRRDFLKIAGITTGGLVAAGVGIPFLMGERKLVFDPNDSYWVQEQPQPNPFLTKDIAVDVAIIGGGYTGLATAWHLSQLDRNLQIIILEAQQVGHGASGRNGGLVLPQTAAETMQIAYDGETHKWTYDLTVRSMRKLATLIKATGVDTDLELNGYCNTILKPDDIPYYRNYVKITQNSGMPLEFWDRKKTSQELGTQHYAGAVFDPHGGQVHPMKLVKALKKAVEHNGIPIYENSPVMNIREGESIQLLVGMEHNKVIAKAIVLATNAYTSKLGYFQHQVLPLHAHCAVTPPLTKTVLDEMGWRSRLPFYDSRNFLYHLLLTPDNRIVIGGGVDEYYFGNDLHFRGDINYVADVMHTEMTRIYPVLQDVPFESVWSGVLGITFEENEGVGVTGKYRNIYYALGYNGHGINLSFLMGNVLAYLYNHKKHEWEDTAYYDYPLKRFPPEPFKWLGAQGLMKYYHWLDGEG